MNVRLAAQTLSSSVADAIEFLDIGMKNPKFQNSSGTVKFTRTIDRLFDMLNSRSPIGKGYRQPLRQSNKNVYEEILKTTANHLLQLKTDSRPSSLVLSLLSNQRLRWLIKCFQNLVIPSSTF